MSNEKRLCDKVALVTGAAKRIGAECVKVLASHGASCVIHYNNSGFDAEKLADEIKISGSEAWIFKADLCKEKERNALLDFAYKQKNKLHILINCASIFPVNQYQNVTEQDFMLNFQINSLAPFFLSRGFLKHNSAENIINFLDSRFLDYDQAHIAYHLSKRSLFTINRILATEAAPKARVNAIAPGLVLPPADEDEVYLEKRKNTNPLQTIGSLRQITDSMLFLLYNDFITGQVIFVDGGRHMRGSFYGV